MKFPRRALVLLTALALTAPAARAGARQAGARGHLLLDGLSTEVRWTDGDSFHVESGPLRGFGTRVQGYNTLESYGPVHRIGGLGPEALQAIASGSAALLAGTSWRCRTGGKRDGYGRALVACPAAWAGGIPPWIVTSLHAAGEKGLDGKPPYDRLVDTRTGRTRLRQHGSSYRTCQEVCVGEGPSLSCMVYVPFERRYRDRPACLTGPKRDR
jgi:micrococcal nuclease